MGRGCAPGGRGGHDPAMSWSRAISPHLAGARGSWCYSSGSSSLPVFNILEIILSMSRVSTEHAGRGFEEQWAFPAEFFSRRDGTIVLSCCSAPLLRPQSPALLSWEKPSPAAPHPFPSSHTFISRNCRRLESLRSSATPASWWHSAPQSILGANTIIPTI